MPATVVAAAAQYEIEYLDAGVNLERAAAAVNRAADDGAALVVLPELANVGYPCSYDADEQLSYFEAAAESAVSFEERLTAVSVEREITVVVGLAKPAPGPAGVLFNVAGVHMPDGTTVYVAKTHLPRIERHYFAAGDDMPVVDTPAGRLGLLICADASFPETARALALRGAEIICVNYMAPAFPNADLYPALTVTRAFENQCFVVASHTRGAQAGTVLTPATTIAGPDGSVLARAGAGSEVVHAVLERSALLRARRAVPRFQTRRPSLYAELVLERDSIPTVGETSGLSPSGGR